MSAALESLAKRRPAESSDRIGTLRRDAFASFEEQGFPTRRLEAWKGTNLAALEAMSFERVGPAGAEAPLDVLLDSLASLASLPRRGPSETQDAPRLVFVDGRFDARHSSLANLPSGVRALPLAQALSDESALLEKFLGRLPDLKREPLAALQTAFLQDAAIVAIDANTSASLPIELCCVSTADSPSAPSAGFPRLLVVAGANSRATLVERHVSAGNAAPGLTAFVAEFHLAAGARLENVQIQSESSDRIHFTSSHARLERDARFDNHVFSIGDGLVRSELSITLAEPGAETRMRGFFLGRNDGHVDHFTTVDHAAEHCTSDEEYRGVLTDRSDGVFRGRVIVRPGAQKSDARQSNPNLLLSDKASIETKPQLEIYADDIRASHGSTIGQLDSDALFFLRARGIDEALARLVLTRAFAHAIVDGVGNTTIREMVAARVDETLASLEPGAAADRRADR